MSNTMSISDVRSDLPNLVSKVSDTLGRYTITVNGVPKAVLMSAEELESLEETAEVLSIPGAKESMFKGLREASNGKGVSLSTLK